jgi:hypothetical protein
MVSQVEMLSNTLAQMQLTNSAFSSSLRGCDSEAVRQEKTELR